MQSSQSIRFSPVYEVWLSKLSSLIPEVVPCFYSQLCNLLYPTRTLDVLPNKPIRYNLGGSKVDTTSGNNVMEWTTLSTMGQKGWTMKYFGQDASIYTCSTWRLHQLYAWPVVIDHWRYQKEYLSGQITGSPCILSASGVGSSHHH